MPMRVLFAGVRVRDLGASMGWYEHFFGRPADIVPNHREVIWQVADGGWLYVIADPAEAGCSLVTIVVDDLDAEICRVTAAGISLGAPETVGDAGRKVTARDLDGNTVALVEVHHGAA